MKFRNALIILIVSIPMLIGMNFVKDIRGQGISGRSSVTFVDTNTNNIHEKIASYGSSEGLIRNVAMITDYTEHNDYTYGKSIGFLTYWWIPRAIWSDKPVMLDYWLIRRYNPNVAPSHSTASSYIGEVYMDFGYALTLLIAFFFGILLSRLQLWIDNNFMTNVKTITIGSFLYGWVFFGVRSIMTATFTLVWVIIFTYVILYLMKKTKLIAVN